MWDLKPARSFTLAFLFACGNVNGTAVGPPTATNNIARGGTPGIVIRSIPSLEGTHTCVFCCSPSGSLLGGNDDPLGFTLRFDVRPFQGQGPRRSVGGAVFPPSWSIATSFRAWSGFDI